MTVRVLEPEVMDDRREALLYDDMDHREVNQAFVAELMAWADLTGSILDVGTGTAKIPILLCQQLPNCQLLGCDLAVSMLDIARVNLAAAGMESRVQLFYADAKKLDCDDQMFDWVISNSLIHHIPDPMQALREMLRVLRTGGGLFVRDLMRPASQDQIEQLVALYACGQPQESQQLLRQSLAAALSLHEIQTMLGHLGLSPTCAAATSDRHWTIKVLR